MAKQEVAIIGAGITGRLLALRLSQLGYQVVIFETHDLRERRGCSFTAAGMLSPYIEAINGEADLLPLGIRSLALWPMYLNDIKFSDPSSGDVYSQHGTLVVAHDQDLDEISEFTDRLYQKCPAANFLKLDAKGLEALEPRLCGRYSQGVFFAEEAHIDTWQVMDALLTTLEQRGVRLRSQTPVEAADGKNVVTQSSVEPFSWVFDCRGVGAIKQFPGLRGVRGETLILKLEQNINQNFNQNFNQDRGTPLLNRPLRILHPRYPLYIVPRSPDIYVVGASMIESDSCRPITVTSALELLTPLYHAHEDFRHASIVGSMSWARPATIDHKPWILTQPGITRINGLFRHGFLLAPIVVDAAVRLFLGHSFLDEQKGLLRSH